MSKQNQQEIRCVPVRELRATTGGEGEGDGRKLTGYAVVYNSLSEELWGFREQFLPGAFTDSLADGHDIRALVEHDHKKLLGRTKSGTLALSEDDRGLRFEIDLPDTTFANDLIASVERGDIDGMSFGFRAVEETYHHDEEGNTVRRDVIKAEIGEITVTSIPAYSETELSLRVDPNAVAQAKALKNETPLLDAARRKLRAAELI